jgi:hypothetical protein
VTWVEYIARLMREGNQAKLKTAWVDLAAEWGTGQAHDMWSLAEARARAADERGDVAQAALW